MEAGGPTPLANKALGTHPTVESMCWSGAGGAGVVNRQAAGWPICQPVPQRRLCVSSMTNRITEDN